MITEATRIKNIVERLHKLTKDSDIEKYTIKELKKIARKEAEKEIQELLQRFTEKG
jgi:SOS-response transcriptional repressor LexA